MKIIFSGAEVGSNRTLLEGQKVELMGLNFWGLRKRGLPKTKRWLISEGQMKSMNDKVEEKHLDYLFKKDFYDLCFKKQLDFPVLMIFMNMRETSGMNKIISKTKSEPNKNA